ncbi:MAG: adenylyltransferase/cytidyltransferase family protein [Phycisphaerales bacterium]|nr:adenylyltransferase/cytidyltransferase family protein [Phycisphaerales bacterium]
MKRFERVLLFGSFDPLHFGHVRLIRRAAELAGCVIVATDSDDLIRAVKGREPVTTLEQRIADLMQVRSVDRVVVESRSEDKLHWIRALQPNALIKGDDWKGKGWPGEGLGVEVLYLPHTPGVSSTALARLIRQQ